jgi:hypothetical protein
LSSDGVYQSRAPGAPPAMIADPEGNLVEIGSWNRGLTHRLHHEPI